MGVLVHVLYEDAGAGVAPLVGVEAGLVGQQEQPAEALFGNRTLLRDGLKVRAGVGPHPPAKGGNDQGQIGWRGKLTYGGRTPPFEGEVPSRIQASDI